MQDAEIPASKLGFLDLVNMQDAEIPTSMV
jgi:hypothetical protein